MEGVDKGAEIGIGGGSGGKGSGRWQDGWSLRWRRLGHPGRAVVDGRSMWSSDESWSRKSGGRSWIFQGDGEGGVKFAGNERFGNSVDDAVDALDEGPADDGIDGDVFTKGDAKKDWAAIVQEVGKVVRDDGSKLAMGNGFGDVGGVRVSDSTSEADRLEGCIRIIEFDKVGHTGRILGGECLVVGVHAAVESSTGVQECIKERGSRVRRFAKGEGDGG